MASAPASRLLSLDVFRGMTIAGMILVNSPGNDTAYAPLDHSAWNGLTPTDMVFPFFVFIVGVSLVFSFRKRVDTGASRTALLRQVLQRTLVIIGIGLFLNGFPYFHLHTMRFPGVLQRIGLCYGIGALFFIFTNTAAEITTSLVLLIGYWWVMTHIAAPGFAAGDLSKEGNLAAYVDRAVFGVHIYRPVYDPEGILSTFPAIASVLLGNLTGRWLASSWTPSQKVTGMMQAGFVMLLFGWKWSAVFPVNKALWTSPFVLVNAGLALLLLSVLYWAIEIRGWKTWSIPFQIFGVNALAAYVLHVFFLKVQNLWHMPRLDGTPGNIRIYISQHVFSGLSPVNASLAYALLYTLLWLGVLTILYRRKIFIKI